MDAYLDGPFVVEPESLVRQLAEYDSAALVDLIHDIEYERIGGMQYSMNQEGRRERQVQESVRAWMNSPLANWIINVWTSYGLGESVKITCDDENAQAEWEECVGRSQVVASDKLHELSNWTLVYGNTFLAQFIFELDGKTTWEEIPSDEIVDIIKSPFSGKALFYKRQFTDGGGVSRTWYYPSADEYFSGRLDEENVLPIGAIRTDQMTNNRTIALCVHIAHNRKDQKQLWGWPVLGVANAPMRAHKEFVENRLTVSRQKASYIREYTTKGGSRGVAAVQAKLASTLNRNNPNNTNPPAAAGSELIHNEAVNVKDLSMATGAGDAKNDNEMFSWYALIGAGLFPTSAGLDTSRWATAVAMDKTQATQWSRYKGFWINQFKRLVSLTLQALERWGGKTFETNGATVTIDTIALSDLPGIVNPISQMIGTLQPFVDNGVVPEGVAKEILQNIWL